MTITNAKYTKNSVTKENCAVSAIINGKQYSVPLDEDNIHYAEIKQQIDAGELTVEDAD
tara:strand:+ start:1657 stop:1833 length:177 start_codon:yes stop_codon:yes gene_type:complete